MKDKQISVYAIIEIRVKSSFHLYTNSQFPGIDVLRQFAASTQSCSQAYKDFLQPLWILNSAFTATEQVEREVNTHTQNKNKEKFKERKRQRKEKIEQK